MPRQVRWAIGLSFIGMACGMFIPDVLEQGDDNVSVSRFGVFGTTVAAFFLAEMGDKSQIATIALTARYLDVPAVVAGTTLGMLIADIPAVLLGDRIAQKVPMTLLRGLAAVVFAVLGVLALLNVGQLL